MRNLNQKLGDMEYDGLITGLTPPARVEGGTVAHGSEKASLPRGALLGKNSDGKLVLYNGATGTTPDCILCDDTEMGTTEDAPVTVYKSGCFDPEKVSVGKSATDENKDYTLTESDLDTLRKYDIVFVAASSMA